MSRHRRTLIVEDQSYEYWLRRSRRAKRIAIHVGVQEGIELVVPWNVSFSVAEAFVREQGAWIARRARKYDRIRATVPVRALVTGETLPLFERLLTLSVKIDPQRKRSHVVLEGTQLIVWVSSDDRVREAITQWYKRQAREYFHLTTKKLSASIGRHVASIRIGSQRSQWGSCSPSGRLSFSWRLLLAPEWVAQYVAAHEVAHLVHANHSPAYWKVTESLDPNTDRAKAWLKEHGHELVL